MQDGTLQTVTDSETLTVLQVKGLTVSGGSIAFTADKVTGTGSIKANAAEKIEVVNNTNLGMTLSDIRILEKGRRSDAERCNRKPL